MSDVLAFVILLLIKATAVTLLGHAAVVLMQRLSASLRYVVLVATLLSLLLLPFLSATAPRWDLPVLRASEDVLPAEVSDAGVPDANETAIAAPDAAAAVPAWPAWLLLALGGGTLFVLARAGIGVIVLGRIARAARPFSGQLPIAVDVRVSERVAVPLLYGIRRPVVLLPEAALSWSDERLRFVLLHESAHIRRGDAVTLLLLRCAAAVYWFHPLVWWLERIARTECERACDDAVLSAGVRPSSYAQELLEIARSLPRHDRLAAVMPMMSRRSQLDGRLRSILGAGVSRRAASRSRALVIATAALCALLPLAALRITAAPAPVEANGEEETEVVDPAIAIRRYDALRAARSRDAEAWTHAGHDLLHAGLNDRAIAALREAVRLDASSEDAPRYLACAYAVAGDSASAFDSLRIAIINSPNSGGDLRRDPHYVRLLTNARFRELLDLADDLRLITPAEAERDAPWTERHARHQRVAGAHPTIGRAWFNLGYSALRIGRPQRAIEAFSRAIELRHRRGTSMYNLACAYAQAGNRDAAIAWLHRAAGTGLDLGMIATDEDLRPLHGDSRFQELLARSKAAG